MKKYGEITVENVLTLILAVVGIGLLVFAAVRLWQINVNADSENAKKILDGIEGKINTLEEGQTGRFTVRGIEGWFLTGWGKNDDSIDKCFFNSCICICEGNGNREVDCKEKGFCRDVSIEKVEVSSLVPSAVYSGVATAGYVNPSEELVKANIIKLPKNLIEIKVKKEKDILKITTIEDE